MHLHTRRPTEAGVLDYLAMIADVVAWRPQGELPFDELSEAVQFVVDSQLEDYVAGYVGEGPEVGISTHFTPLTINSDGFEKMNKNVAFGKTLWFAVVVSDEPLGEEEARAVYDKYIAQLAEEEVDDGRPGSGRDAGQSPEAPEKSGSGEVGTDTDIWKDTESMVDPSLVIADPDKYGGFSTGTDPLCIDNIPDPGTSNNSDSDGTMVADTGLRDPGVVDAPSRQE